MTSHKLNLGDGDSVLSLLYEAYGDSNRMYDDQIKADFAELYQILNGTPLQEMVWIVNPVCALCRDHGYRFDFDMVNEKLDIFLIQLTLR